MSYKRFFLSFALFASFFLTFLLIFATIWIKKTFGAEVEIAQILFHIQYPIADTDPAFIRGFALKALLPSLLVSLALVVPLRILASGVRAMWRLGRVGISKICAGVRRVFGFGARHSVALRMVACLGFIVCAIKLIDTKFQVREFLAQNASKAYGSFYETHYATPPFEEIATQFASLQSPRNLIVIFAESLESTYSAKSTPTGIGGGGG